MAIRNVITAPNSILSTPGDLISDFRNDRIRLLIDDMKETVIQAGGVGLAAPQVGESLRLIVINYRQAPFALINPIITSQTNSSTILEEGCLSVPDIIVPIRRSRNVTVTAINEQSEKIEIHAKDLLAKILQHEIDHTNGIIITDYSHEG